MPRRPDFTFDTALPELARLVGLELGNDAVTRGDVLFLRDARGILTAVPRTGIAKESRERLERACGRSGTLYRLRSA